MVKGFGWSSQKHITLRNDPEENIVKDALMQISPGIGDGDAYHRILFATLQEPQYHILVLTVFQPQDILSGYGFKLQNIGKQMVCDG